MKTIAPITKEEAIDILKVTPEAMKCKTNWQRYILNTTELWEGVADRHLVVIWGLIPPTLVSSTAYLWSYTFPSLEEHTFVFVRGSQLVIRDLLSRYETIVGHTEPTDTKAIKWLKWLGAEFGKRDANGLPFEIRREDG